MKRILIIASVILISLSLTLTGCGSKTSLTYTNELTEKLRDYEVEKIEDDLTEYTGTLSQAYSTISAIIYQSDPGKTSLKESFIADVSKEVKSSIKKLKRMNVPKRVEDIHDLFIEELYLIEDGFENLKTGFKENDHYKLYMGKTQITAFFGFYSNYLDVYEYLESEDFDLLRVRTLVEKFQIETELSIVKQKIEVLNYMAVNGTDLDGNDTTEENAQQEEPLVVIPEDPVVSDPSPQIPLQWEEEQIIANSNVEIISSNKLEQLELYQINLAKNEIFARHGYVFKDPGLQYYFESRGWYRPDSTFTDDLFSEIEKTNIALLKEEEANRKGEVYAVTSNREAWSILTDMVPNYTTPDLSDDEYYTVYSEPFYCFPGEYFDADNVTGDMQYAVSLITGKVYEYYSNGDILPLN